ncbi:MAG: ATP synthase F1 subunit gamma [Sedimentisphaerales bacterium]|nr:ATP synthase F1 subunit gamma [Sedimentisphaerales bacterium]
MATTREIVKRRNSISNIRKITKTMEMIATARFKKTHMRATGGRPYTDNLSRLLSAMVVTLAGEEQSYHPLLETNQQSRRYIVLVLTSNRGLCGGFNSNLIKTANEKLQTLKREGLQIELRVSGKKGIQYFKFHGYEVPQRYTDFDHQTSFQDIEPLADEFMELYSQKQIDKVVVVYNRFVSSSEYYPDVLDLLPIGGDEIHTQGSEESMKCEDYTFSPEPGEILEELIPATVRMRLFQCFIDTIASEQISRMKAMKAATENAEQMIRSLSRQYNRARQTQITNELLDIIGGAEAIG